MRHLVCPFPYTPSVGLLPYTPPHLAFPYIYLPPPHLPQFPTHSALLLIGLLLLVALTAVVCLPQGFTLPLFPHHQTGRIHLPRMCIVHYLPIPFAFPGSERWHG